MTAVNLLANAVKRYKGVDRQIAVVWKMLVAAENSFRRLPASELIADVYLGARYKDGVPIEATIERTAACTFWHTFRRNLPLGEQLFKQDSRAVGDRP